MQDTKKWILSIPINTLIGFTATVFLDIIFVLFKIGEKWSVQMLSPKAFVTVFFVCFLLSLAVSLLAGKSWNIIIGSLSILFWVVLVVSTICWYQTSKNLTYEVADSGKTELYGNQRIMAFVPHQDDDINILGGVLEEYVKYGSEVYVVFSTNGDYCGLAETRLQEAVDVMAHIGIPEENVIFLGYGDMWSVDGPHLYNAEPGVVCTSHIGRTKTYGMTGHEAYNEGADYTIDNFLSDIESVILEFRPDVLYCIDYDYHTDHSILMHSFEKVMGKILKQDETYRPVVLKGYGYKTAWEAVQDFYEENLLPTQNIFGEPHHQSPEIYRWEERVRLPIHAEDLSRSAFWSDAYRTLAMYASQTAGRNATKVYNSDKVFWQRRTDSQCYNARIQTSSGEAELLNNFMLLDSQNVRDGKHMPCDGVWIPDEKDQEKTICVTFSELEPVEQIVLYDHPDPEINVLNARITFDDGTVVESGPLHVGGAATVIPVNKDSVRSFEISLTRVQGNAGITELESYAVQERQELNFIKIMDEAQNFVYDYWIDPSGKQEFVIYTSGDMPETSAENYRLTCDNEHCTAQWQGNRIQITCPVGEKCVVTLADLDGKAQDAVVIRNPAQGERNWIMFWLKVEDKMWIQCGHKQLHKRLVLCRLLAAVL